MSFQTRKTSVHLRNTNEDILDGIQELSEATSTRSQSFPYPIFFFPRLNKYLHPHETTKLTQNDVVYMPDQHVAL